MDISSPAKQTLRCQYQGGAGREEQYRPPTPCLGEFQVGPKNAKRAKYCKVCAPFAKKALSAENAAAAYKADPKTHAKITLTNRHNRRKAAGRPIRPIGSMQACQYPDKNGKRAEGCKRTFKVRSSAQKFCDPCQLRADADRAQDYRDKHHDELLVIYRNRGADLRKHAAIGKKFPPDWDHWPLDWKIIGTELLSVDYLSNPDLGTRMDSSRILKCPYSENWEKALSGPKLGSKRAINLVGQIRKRLGKPARLLQNTAA